MPMKPDASTVALALGAVLLWCAWALRPDAATNDAAHILTAVAGAGSTPSARPRSCSSRDRRCSSPASSPRRARVWSSRASTAPLLTVPLGVVGHLALGLPTRIVALVTLGAICAGLVGVASDRARHRAGLSD